jgi:hypothetical protein
LALSASRRFCRRDLFIDWDERWIADGFGRIDRSTKSGNVPLPALDVSRGLSTANLGLGIEYGSLGQHHDASLDADIHLTFAHYSSEQWPKVTSWNVLRKQDRRLA